MTKLLGFGVAGIAAFTAACLAFIQLATSAPAAGSADAARTPSPPVAQSPLARRTSSRGIPRSVPPAVPAADRPTASADTDTDALVERALGPAGASPADGTGALPGPAAGLPQRPAAPDGSERRRHRPSWSTTEDE